MENIDTASRKGTVIRAISLNACGAAQPSRYSCFPQQFTEK